MRATRIGKWVALSVCLVASVAFFAMGWVRPLGSNKAARWDWRCTEPAWSLPVIVVTASLTAFLWYRDAHGRAGGRCQKCGYNLTGNVSGRCPECGTPLRPHAQHEGK